MGQLDQSYRWDRFRIPEMTFDYSVKSPINYTSGGKPINITSPTVMNSYTLLQTHQMYSNNSKVIAEFYNSSDFTDNIDIYLTKTSPTELKNVFDKLIEGILNISGI